MVSPELYHYVNQESLLWHWYAARREHNSPELFSYPHYAEHGKENRLLMVLVHIIDC